MKVYIINSIAKSYILNIKIRPLVTEYALMIKLVDGTSSAHSFNPYAYFGHEWSYFDIQNLRLAILYIHTLSLNITCICIRHIWGEKCSPSVVFLHFPIPHAILFYSEMMFVYSTYMFLKWALSKSFLFYFLSISIVIWMVNVISTRAL